MEITVKSIDPDGSALFQEKGQVKMRAVVHFDDGADEYSTTAWVEVWLDKRDAPLSELKNEAIALAKAFLSSAINDSH